VLFSVVIPTHDRVGLLRRTLESVFAQRFSGYEVIVVDDGSTDATPEYLASLGTRVTALRQQNAGPGAARNAGIARAQGEYVAFLDSDDLWFPWTLDSMAALVEAHGRPAIVAARAVEFRDESELAAICEEPPRAERFADFLAASSRPFAVGSGTATIRRSLLAGSGGFTTRRINAEDHDLVLRLGTAPGFDAEERPVLVAVRREGAGVSFDMERLAAGCEHLVAQEGAGAYPGGQARARERREIVARHVRPVSLECVRQGRIGAGWSLYSRTLRWHVGLNRWRYLLGFPARAAARALSPGPGGVARGR